MGKKALFFDIDGTIWDVHNNIPDSTRLAMKELKDNGHLIFLNSGRGRGFIFNEDLLSLGFDGIISGCGTRIEYHDDVIYYEKMDVKLIEWLLDVCEEFDFAAILEGPEYLYMDPEKFINDNYVKKISKELGHRLKGISDNTGKWEATKFSISCGVPRRDEGYRKLSEHFKVIPHTDSVAELVPIGHSKATGILKVCELLNIDIKDTYAFGDSGNDLEMLEAAGTGICMGDGFDCAKEAADYVTTDMMDDGIRNACLHFGLI